MMKQTLIAFAFALSASAGQAAVLYDNGPVVNGSGLSILTAPSTTYGFGAQTSAGNSVADNFSVGAGGWSVGSLDFYSYQTSAAGFTFTTATWSIVLGDVNTGTIVASGTTAVTNAGLIGYRVTPTTLGDQSRGIYRLNADIADLVLAAGNYFLTWSLAGTGASGPWVPPVDGPLGGDALQAVADGPFFTLVEVGSGLGAELPFRINSTAAAPPAVPEPATWAMMIGGFALSGAAMRRRKAAVSFA